METQIFQGPVECLLEFINDSEITDILINGTQGIYIEKYGELKKLEIETSKEFLFFLRERILVSLGKRWDANRPYLDGKLFTGHRFHILGPPAVEHFCFSFRRHLKVSDIQNLDFCGSKKIQFLKEKLQQRQNIIICGGTGSGKTTLLSLLLQSVSLQERLLILEESQEIPIDHPHCIRLESRPPGPEGNSEITLQMLLKQALRMRPDRIVLGECRGAEAMDLIQAWNTGHLGSLTTIHANSCLSALSRLENLARMADPMLPPEMLRSYIAQLSFFVVLVQKVEKVRKIAEIIEVLGLEGAVYRFRPIP